MRVIVVLVSVVLLAGCASGRLRSRDIEGEDDGTAPGPSGPTTMVDPDMWLVTVDTSATNPYLPATETTATIRGTVRATLGPGSAEVDGSPARLDASGGFSATAPVPPGLSLVPVEGQDVMGNAARGDRAVLRADYLPEGEMDLDAIRIAVDDALLSGLVSGALAGAGGLDSLSLSSFITPGTELVSGSPCTISIVSVSHDPPTLSLRTTEDGRLQAVARVTNIRVNFQGRCNALGMSITVRPQSQMDDTDVELTMFIEPRFPPSGGCASGLSATAPHARFTRFDLDLRLSGCGLLCLAGSELIGEIAEGAVKRMIERQVNAMIGPSIGSALGDVSLLETSTRMDFLGTPVDVSLCMTGLESTSGTLVATMGASARGPGGTTSAPGAPRLPASSGELAPRTLSIDPALVGQILFSAWRGGALRLDSLGSSGSGSGPALTIDLLAGVVGALRPLVGSSIPRGAPLTIGIDAAMAPLARAPSPMEAAAGADLMLELGDLRLRLGAAGRELFVISSTVRLGLALEPNDEGALVPALVREATRTDTHVAETTVPGVTERMASSLARLVDGQVAAQIGPLLSGAAIRLPDVGAPLRVERVEPGPGGTLFVTLGAAPTP